MSGRSFIRKKKTKCTENNPIIFWWLVVKVLSLQCNKLMFHQKL
nr:MAG TPA: hypothetical protein [Caudoviricetes sp.]DAN19892.1 MAG TPA: hypothetical protein [Caudoviricetes sp.]